MKRNLNKFYSDTHFCRFVVAHHIQQVIFKKYESHIFEGKKKLSSYLLFDTLLITETRIQGKGRTISKASQHVRIRCHSPLSNQFIAKLAAQLVSLCCSRLPPLKRPPFSLILPNIFCPLTWTTSIYPVTSEYPAEETYTLQ